MMCYISTIRNMTSNVVSSSLSLSLFLFFFNGQDYVETMMAHLIGLMD